MIARIRAYFHARALRAHCHQHGHKFECRHCYDPTVLRDIIGFNIETGERSCLRISKQDHKMHCTHCGFSRLITTDRAELIEAP